MFLSLEIDIKLCQKYTKTYIYQICRRVVVLNRSYSTNTKPIWKWLYIPQEPENLIFAPVIIFISIFSRHEHHIDALYICIVQRHEILKFILYPLSFFLYSPFKLIIYSRVVLYLVQNLQNPSPRMKDDFLKMFC